ncbi:MAG: aminotransferase DegT, partial [Desulfobacterales bacterium]|nr:aminotransferase DegT [Desulfobacterales bacterium]
VLITPEEFSAEREQARPVWKPMHMQPVFRSADYADYEDSKPKKPYPCRVVGGSVAEDLFERGLCLPSGTAMTEEDLDRVSSAIRRCGK